MGFADANRDKGDRMRPVMRLIFALCAMFLLSAPAHAAEGRHALVIGNSAYDRKPLKNPVNDARDMAAALERLGFDVLLRTDVGQRNMEEAIRDFGVKLKGGGVGIFYYAGHGIQVNGANYLVPIGARLASESDARYECVDAGRVLGKMEDAGNELNIVILDACRNNPFASSFRSADQGLARMDAPTGSLVAYATAPNSVASDGGGRNGLYTKHLLKNLNTPGVPIEEVFKRVRIGVMGETGKKQVPWESSSLAGYFYLAGGQPQGQAAVAASQLAAAQAERQRQAQDARLKEYIAGLEDEKRKVEQEKAELLRRRQQLDAEAAQRLKQAQAPQEARLREQLAILEAERRKLEQERQALTEARAKVEKGALSASTAHGTVPDRPSLAAVASRPGKSGIAVSPSAVSDSRPVVEDRAAILARLAGTWRLETEDGLSLPLLVLRPGGDTLYGDVKAGGASPASDMRLTGLAMQDGNLHVRLSEEVRVQRAEDVLRFIGKRFGGVPAERVVECVGYLRVAGKDGIPLFCECAEKGAREPGRRIPGRMVRVAGVR
jgi:uncharacterized caspase-like protein